VNKLKQHSVIGGSYLGLWSIRPIIDPPHLPGRSTLLNLRGGRNGEMGRIDHGGVCGRSAPLE